MKCPHRAPQGEEIYRKDTLSVFEVDGKKSKVRRRPRWTPPLGAAQVADAIGRNRSPARWVGLRTALLPKLVPAGQALLGPQDAVLRRGAVPVLRYDRVGRARRAHSWLLFQGKVLAGRLQRGVYPDAPAVPAQGLRPPAHPVQYVGALQRSGGGLDAG